jgi:type II secretory pathway component GspD/PulD (secretin)
MRIIRYILPVGMLAVLLMGTALKPAIAQQNAGDNVKRVTINFKDVAIKSAIDMLFEGSGQNYAFEPGVTGTVNVKLVDIPFPDALSAVLKAANLTMRKDKAVYIIGPQKEAPPVVLAPPPAVVKEAAKPAPKKVVIKIPVGYADAFDIAAVFGVTGTRSSAASMTSGTGTNGSSSSGGLFGSSSGSSSSGSKFGSSSSSSTNRSSSSSSSSRW